MAKLAKILLVQISMDFLAYSDSIALVTIDWRNEIEACSNQSAAIVICNYESLDTRINGKLKYSSSPVWTRDGENIRDDDRVYATSTAGLTSALLTVYETPEGPVDISCYLPLNDGSGNIMESNMTSIAVGLTKPILPIVKSDHLNRNGTIILSHNNVCFSRYKFYPMIILNDELLNFSKPMEFDKPINVYETDTELALDRNTTYKLEIYAVCEERSIRSSPLVLFANTGSQLWSTQSTPSAAHGYRTFNISNIMIISMYVILALF